MGSYIGRRTPPQRLFSLIGLIILVFFLARLTGDPTNLFLPIDASVETRQDFAERHGFNDPLIVQFLPISSRALAQGRFRRINPSASPRSGRGDSRPSRRRSMLAAFSP